MGRVGWTGDLRITAVPASPARAARDALGGDASGAAGSTSHAPFGQKYLSDYGEEGR
jgi:hypothetical protein